MVSWTSSFCLKLKLSLPVTLRRIPFKIGKFTNIKALFQVVSVDFPFTWSRSTRRGRVSTLSVPGFHMQGHCNTRKIYTYFNKGCFGIWTFKHRIQCNALLEWPLNNGFQRPKHDSQSNLYWNRCIHFRLSAWLK